MINNEGIAALVTILREQTALLRQHTQLLESILQQLERLQSSAVGAAQQTQPPSISSTYRYERNIKEFPEFDWVAIGCSVRQRDRHQFPTVVLFQGAEYTRRNKDDEIWFSRKTPQGYDRLIKFGKNTKVKSISEDIREAWEG